MCGRFIVSYTYNELLEFLSSSFDIFDFDPNVDVPNFNVTPGSDVLSIISDGEQYRVGTFKWGFIPFFAKDVKSAYKMINSRVEGIESRAAFKDSFVNKRCIVLADGYYEWKKDGKQKTPFPFQKNNKEIFFFPGIWSKYNTQDSDVIFSTSIITKKANNLMTEIHPRMPIILDEETAKKWLDPVLKEPQKLLAILDADSNEEMFKMRVSEYVNKVGNNSKKCIEEYIDINLF